MRSGKEIRSVLASLPSVSVVARSIPPSPGLSNLSMLFSSIFFSVSLTAGLDLQIEGLYEGDIFSHH